MNDDAFFSDEVQRGIVEEEDVPRDGRGRYLLPHPDTGELKGRTRVTTLAGSVGNDFQLTRWKIRMIVRGMGLRADLMARAGAAHPDDDGYNGLLDSIAEAAFEAAGGSWGSNLGTAQHKVFERHFFHGVSIEELPEYFHGDLRAVRAALDFHGIELLPQYIERTVYNTLYDRGGRLDAIGRLRDGSLAIIDLKTEKDPKQYPKGKTVQLAYYANSDRLMNYDTQQYEPMPQLHRDFALVIWCRPGSGEAQILSVPIDIGWVGARIAEQNRAWNSTKVVVAPYMSDANYAQVPSDLTVTPDGQTFYGQPSTQMAQPGQVIQQQPQQLSTNCGTCQEMLCPTCHECVSGQCPRTACRCQQVPGTETWIAPTATSDVPQQQAGPGYPMAQLSPADGLTPPNGHPTGNAAAVGAIVDQAIQTGQIGPQQVQQLNQQAAAMLTRQPRSLADTGLPPAPAQPPGQPIIGPGTAHPVTTGIDAQPPAGVAPDRPPAPKSSSAKLSPAELMNDLINRSQAGIDEEAFWIEIKDELKGLSKKEQLQPLLRLLQPGIDEKMISRHREPLADMVIERVKQQREIRARQSGGAAPATQEAAVQATPAHQEVPAQATPPAEQAPAWAQQAPGVTAEQPPVIDLTYEAAMAAITNAPNPDRLVAIYQQWVGTYGPQNWIEPMNNAYWHRMNTLTAPTPVG